MNFLKGKLTYGLAALAIAGAVAGFLIGAIDQETAIGMVWAGLAVFGIRRAIGS